MRRPALLSRYEMIVIQLLYSGAAAGFIYPGFIIRSTVGAYWIPVMVWVAGALLSSWLYGKLLGRLDGGTLIFKLRAATGTIGAIILMLPIILFLFTALVVMLRAYTEMITMTMLPTTPISFLNGLLLAPAALALAGIMPIARTAKVFFIITLLLTVLLLAVSLSDIDWTLGIPWLRSNGDFFGDKQFYAGSFMWMGFVITSSIGPYTSRTARHIWGSYAIAILCAIPLVAAYIYLRVLTFGRELSQRLTFPFVSKMDSISHYWVVFENLTAIFVSVTMFYVLLILALKIHVLGEIFRGLAPRFHARAIYAGVFIAVYTTATAITSWRILEQIIAITVGLRLYVMFVFPLLGIVILLCGQKRIGKEA